MRTETIIRTLYTYSELSPAAQEQAYEEWIESGPEYFWESENRASLTEFCATFPVKVTDYEYGGYRPGHISWKFTESGDVAELSGVRLRTYLLNRYASIFRRLKQYRKGDYLRYSRMQFEAKDCPFTGYCMDESLLRHIRAFIQKPDSRTFYDLLNDCLNEWVTDCAADVEYQQSEEQFAELAEANGYEFTENGTLA